MRDVGSLNGTYVNRQRIDEAVLNTGDEVQIGKFRLVFYAARPEPGTVAAHGRRGASPSALCSRPCARTSPTSPSPRSASSRPRGWSSRPARPPATASSRRTDVERLRYVLRAQRDHFWPLRVIREALDALDRGLMPGDGVDGRPQPPGPGPDPDVPGRRPRRRRDRADDPRRAGRAAGLAPAEVAALSAYGLLRPDAGGLYDEPTCSSPTRPRAWPATGSSPATCGRSGPPPTARSAWSSRSSARGAATTPSGRGGEAAHLCLCCTPPWSRAGSSGRGGLTAAGRCGGVR